MVRFLSSPFQLIQLIRPFSIRVQLKGPVCRSATQEVTVSGIELQGAALVDLTKTNFQERMLSFRFPSFSKKKTRREKNDIFLEEWQKANHLKASVWPVTITTGCSKGSGLISSHLVFPVLLPGFRKYEKSSLRNEKNCEFSFATRNVRTDLLTFALPQLTGTHLLLYVPRLV